MQLTYYKWFENWKANNQYERLGQHFVNCFIRHPWPELFHCTNDAKSSRMIFKWLTDHQYWPNMPVHINDIYAKMMKEGDAQ